MLEGMGDHEYYCASYSSKDQPHIDGLLMTLAEGKLAKERDIAQAKEAGENISAHEEARQTLHRLVSSTNRRMHKGFPEMLTYLMRKPSEYASHKFVDTEIFQQIAWYTATLYRRLGQDTPSSTKHRDPHALGKIPHTIKLKVKDYAFRPHALENFPLYFFISACVASKELGPDNLDWVVLDGSEGALRQSTAEVLMSKTYDGICLRWEDEQPIYKYAYYVHLQLNDAWRIPVIHGRLPGPPHDDATPYQKGSYGLMMLLLFRPHRLPDDLWDYVFGTRRVPKTIDEAYEQIYEQFLQWRRQLVERQSFHLPMAFPASQRCRLDRCNLSFPSSNLKRDSAAGPPVFNTSEWWADLLLEKLRNYDVATRRHTVEANQTPTLLERLPEYLAPPQQDKDDADVMGECASDASSVSEGPKADPDDLLENASQAQDKTERRRDAGKTNPLAMHCGTLPTGCVLEEFHQPPTRVHARNLEGRYWKEFSTQVQETFPQPSADTNVAVSTTSWQVTNADALTAAENQKSFFKCVDNFQVDPESLTTKTQVKPDI